MKTNRIAVMMFLGLIVTGILIFTQAALAADKVKQDTASLAKQSQNPVSSLISVPLNLTIRSITDRKTGMI